MVPLKHHDRHHDQYLRLRGRVLVLLGSKVITRLWRGGGKIACAFAQVRMKKAVRRVVQFSRNR
jgi:hypothetical protein